MSEDQSSLAGDSGPTALDNTGTGNAIAGIVAGQSDAGASATEGLIGGGRTGITGSAGLPGAGGQLSGSEPTDIGDDTGMSDIGPGAGAQGTSTASTIGHGDHTLGGIAGTGVGGTGTHAGGGIGARSGGTGDIGGMGGSSVDTASADGGTGTQAIGGVGGGIGTSDEGAVGSSSADAGTEIGNIGEEPR